MVFGVLVLSRGWSEGGEMRAPLLFTITCADRRQRRQRDSVRCPCAAGSTADGGAGRKYPFIQGKDVN